MPVSDKQLDKEFVYFLCAYYFHWTPKQVNEQEAYLIDSLLTMLPLWKQKIKDVLENG